MRVGLLGGTFDPPHVGHLLMAQNALETLRLDQVWFVPTGDSHWKEGVTPAAMRVAMTDLAIDGNPDFRVSLVDVERDGETYTLDTLEALVAQKPETEFFFLVGSDNAPGLNGWRDIDRCMHLASFAVGKRQDADVEIPAELSGSVVTFDTMVTGVSSTLIRRYIQLGRSVRYAVPEAVEKFIGSNDLYGARPV
jgi:nicotinate-nucleotide adenylyltransferase